MTDDHGLARCGDPVGPLTADVTSVMGSLLELGAWAFASDKDGTPTGADLKIKADVVPAKLSGQMQDAAKTFWNMAA